MKLSEAILLGSTLIRPKAGVIYESTRKTGGLPAGCALGMAAIALGFDLEAICQRTVVGFDIPVMDKIVEAPCNCWNHPRTGLTESKAHVGNYIVHLFDTHVMCMKDWTLEQLVDWVSQQEPKELPAAEVAEEEFVAV